MDICILLLLMERFELKKKCVEIIVDSILQSKLFLETLLLMVTELSLVWEQHPQALLLFAKYLMELGNKHFVLLQWANEFYTELFLKIHGLRVEIIAALLSSCNSIGEKHK